MEAAQPIQFETTKPILDKEKINFIEELKIKKEKGEHKIQLGIKEDNLVIKVTSENLKDIFYYQQSYTINELQNLSKIFAVYETVKDIIAFLKELKYELEEINDILIIKFGVFMPNGKSKLIELNLKKCLPDNNYMINYLLEKIKSIEINMKNLEENSKKEKIKYESEIKDMKENNLKYQINISNLIEEKFKKERTKYESEIKGLKEYVTKYQNESKELKEKFVYYKIEISNLKEENKKLCEEINNLKKFHISKTMNDSNLKFSSIIGNDLNKIKLMQNWIEEAIRKKEIKYKLIFKMSENGNKSNDFHKYCDNKGPTLTLIKTTKNKIFGGFTPLNWKNQGSGTMDETNQTFIFSLNLKKKYNMLKKDGYAIYCTKRYGPNFGDCDFDLKENMKTGESYANSNCNYLSNYNLELTGGKGDHEDFETEELEVYKVTY